MTEKQLIRLLAGALAILKPSPGDSFVKTALAYEKPLAQLMATAAQGTDAPAPAGGQQDQTGQRQDGAAVLHHHP